MKQTKTINKYEINKQRKKITKEVIYKQTKINYQR